MKEKNKSTKKNFFWDYERKWFSVYTLIFFGLSSIALYIFAGLSYFLWKYEISVTLPLLFAGTFLSLLVMGPLIGIFWELFVPRVHTFVSLLDSYGPFPSEKEKKIAKKSFFWDYKKHYFSISVRIFFLIMVVALCLSASIIGYFLKEESVVIVLVLSFMALIFFALALGPILSHFY